jgi:transcriptional regulator with XRE-family HTH domain
MFSIYTAFIKIYVKNKKLWYNYFYKGGLIYMNKSSYFLPINLIESINNLFQDKTITTKTIADECGLTVPYVSTLRQGKRDLEKTSFETIKKLYWYATNRHVDFFSIEKQKLKGKYNSVSLNLSVSKLIVSFDDQQLFYQGIVNPFHLIENQQDLISIPRSIFISKRGEQLDPETFGYTFNCGYSGTGPNNLVLFLEKYSPYSRIELEQFIFSNKNLIYNFATKKLSAFDSNLLITSSSIEIVKQGSSLNFIFPGKSLFSDATPNNDKVLNKVCALLNLLTNKFKIESSLISIKYMKQRTDETLKTSALDEKHNFVLKYYSFQIQFYLEDIDINTSELIDLIQKKLYSHETKKLKKVNTFHKNQSVEEYVFK